MEKTMKQKNKPTIVHVWGGHGEGGLYINGKKVSNYYTIVQNDILKALGFEAKSIRLNEEWFRDRIYLPENLKDCRFANETT
jgi:hypothetical protein